MAPSSGKRKENEGSELENAQLVVKKRANNSNIHFYSKAQNLIKYLLRINLLQNVKKGKHKFSAAERKS